MTASRELAYLTATLSDKQANLTAHAGALLIGVSQRQLATLLDDQIPKRQTFIEYVATVFPLAMGKGTWPQILAALFSYRANQAVVHRRRSGVLKSLEMMRLYRPVLSFTDKERALLRAYGALAAQRLVTASEWQLFEARVVLGDGKAVRIDPRSLAQDPDRAAQAREFLHKLVASALPPYDHVLAEAARVVVGQAPAGPGAPQALSEGARWMTPNDMTGSSPLSLQKVPASLTIGYLPDERPVYFSGNESLLTVGGPGCGKTMCQVIPNLLTYPGSAVVLDVKGELWETTAAHRQRQFGPVYRFAPVDPDGRSHRFNPFDFISADPAKAPSDCEVFGYQIISENPKLHDPYWENKGRDFLWAFGLLLALSPNRELRNLSTLAQLSGIPLLDNSGAGGPVLHDDLIAIIDRFRKLAKRHDIPDLAQAASALESGAGQDRLESVMDTMRRYLSTFGRSPMLRAATKTSDWSPQDLRRRPGTTVYICIPEGEVRTYAPIIRLMFFQHLRLLRGYTAKPGEPPITFFLDEMPQLGRFESILTMQDTGRSAGLRLWMFAQNLGQIRDAYGRERAASLVGSCRVSCYMQPDAETAQLLSKALGESRNLLTGEKQPLATPDALSGRTFADKALVLPRAEDPVALEKRFAWATMKNLMQPPPPVRSLL